MRLAPSHWECSCQGSCCGKACTELSTATEVYRAMDMTFQLPQAEAALAQAGSALALPQYREL
jgi:hypothetical protein